MPFDLTPLDIGALAFFFTAWGGFTLLLDRSKLVPPTLNRHMREVRLAWMRNLMRRDNRIMDTQLIGHLISSVSFFASTTVLLLAGLVAVLFELKIVLMLAIFVFAFFKFTWALRQYNYACGLIGAAPHISTPGADEAAEEAATLLSLAVLSFNGGLRAYYFAFAALGWFLHPLALVGFTAWIMVVLLRRQYTSPAAAAVRKYRDVVAPGP